MKFMTVYDSVIYYFYMFVIKIYFLVYGDLSISKYYIDIIDMWLCCVEQVGDETAFTLTFLLFQLYLVRDICLAIAYSCIASREFPVKN